MDEEREIYDAERESTDERFRELEAKIKGNRNFLSNFVKKTSSFMTFIRVRRASGQQRQPEHEQPVDD